MDIDVLYEMYKNGYISYSDYKKERKVANRKEKEKKRGVYYYAHNHNFSKNNIELPKEFENKKDLINYIRTITEDNPQTYVSTLIQTQNQGVVPSCEKQKYKECC